MSDSTDPHRPEDEAPIQVDWWGFKFRAASAAKEYQPPKTLKGAAVRVKEHLLALAVAPLAFADSVTRALINTVSGAGGLLVRPNAAKHQKAADDEEDRRQAALEEREQHDDPETDIVERLEALEEILDELRAKGIAVQASDLGEQRVALYLVSSEQVDVAREIVEEEFLPKLEVDLAADVLTQPISYLNLSARAERGLSELGVSTIADLLQRTAGELLAVKGFGEATLAEVRQKLGDVNLKLRGD